MQIRSMTTAGLEPWPGPAGTFPTGLVEAGAPVASSSPRDSGSLGCLGVGLGVLIPQEFLSHQVNRIGLLGAAGQTRNILDLAILFFGLLFAVEGSNPFHFRVERTAYFSEWQIRKRMKVSPSVCF